MEISVMHPLSSPRVVVFFPPPLALRRYCWLSIHFLWWSLFRADVTFLGKNSSPPDLSRMLAPFGANPFPSISKRPLLIEFFPPFFLDLLFSLAKTPSYLHLHESLKWCALGRMSPSPKGLFSYAFPKIPPVMNVSRG